jgi:hypothetical protein
MAGRAVVKPTKREEPNVPLEERIRRRAHEIYLQHGGRNQSQMDDWLQAESEILRGQQTGQVQHAQG